MKYELFSPQSLNFALGHRLSTGQGRMQTQIYIYLMPKTILAPLRRKLSLFGLRHRDLKTNLTYNFKSKLFIFNFG